MIKEVLTRETDKDRVLNRVCNFLDKTNYQKIVKDLKDTFKEQVDKCVGLAAPQIGYPYKAFAIIDVEKGKEKRNPLVMINPNILSYSKENVISHEGCMSLERGKEWIMVRAKEIKVSYYDEQFKLKVKQFKGLQSRAIQHEYDHLFGKCVDELGKPFEIKEEIK